MKAPPRWFWVAFAVVMLAVPIIGLALELRAKP